MDEPRALLLAAIATFLLLLWSSCRNTDASDPPVQRLLPPEAGHQPLFTIDTNAFLQSKHAHGRRPKTMFVSTGQFRIGGMAIGDVGFVRFTLKSSEPSIHFGCFLHAQSSSGEATCLDAHALPPGRWSVEVIMVRRCRPNEKRCAERVGSILESSHASIAYLDYVIRGDFQRFQELQTSCLMYPYSQWLSATWSKTSQPSSHVQLARENSTSPILPSQLHARAQPLPLCLASGRPGRWLPLAADKKHSGECPPELCVGSIPNRFLNNDNDTQNGMHHVFAPFGCLPAFKPASFVAGCVKAARLLLVGDSRTAQLHAALTSWLEDPNAIQFLPLHKPLRLGLRHALRIQVGDAFRDALRQNRAIVINSVLHDVADFYSTTTLEDVQLSYSDWSQCAADCQGYYASDCECRKTRAVHAYFDTLREFRKEVEMAAWESATPARVHWLSLHKRSPLSGERELFSWQTADAVWELESAAARILAPAGVRHIDLRHMTLAAPPEWWNDQAHFGKDPGSLFQHVVMQAMLSEVCDWTTG